MIKEEEAKKLICAFNVSLNCIGSGCMSWKYELVDSNNQEAQKGTFGMPVMKKVPKLVPTGKGYCKRLERVIHG